MLLRKAIPAKEVRRTSTLSPAYPPRIHWRAKLLMALLMGASAGNLHAQWIVEDPAAISKMASEYVETAKRWKDQYDHYQQQLIKLKRLTFAASQFVDNFPERDPYHGMEMACPSDNLPANPTEAFQQLPPDVQGDVVKEQHKLCQRIVLAENDKYNETVRMLKTLIQRHKEYERVETQRASMNTSQGDLAANDNEAQRLLTRTMMDMEFWQTRMKAYDAYIASLKSDSGLMAKCAMKSCSSGLKKLIGNVVQATTLKAALSVD